MSDQGPVAPETQVRATALPEGAEAPPGTETISVGVTQKAQRISNEELKGMVGELSEEDQLARAREPQNLIVDAPVVQVNRDGWMPIDEAGTPTGSAVLRPPDDGETPAFPVRVNALAVPSEIVTPSGAEILDANMQPSPQLSKYSSPSYRRHYAAIAAMNADERRVHFESGSQEA